MVSADVVTRGASQGDWVVVALFLFFMWGVSMFLIERKNKRIKELKKILEIVNGRV